jgi:hypothetical protein
MKLHQLSVFVENRPGQLKAVCQALNSANFNLQTLTLADTKEFGIVRMILQDWEHARSVLEQAGFVTVVSEVLALEVADRPGGLLEVLGIIEEADLNVEYMYAFAFGQQNKAILVFRFDNADTALERLRARGVNVIGGVELA